MDYYKVFYVLTCADDIKHFFDVFSNWLTAFSIAFFIAYVISGIALKDKTVTGDDREAWKMYSRVIRRSFWVSFIVMIVLWGCYVFTPSKQNALLILAGGTVGNFITSDSSSKQIPAEAMLLLREKIRSEIKQVDAGNNIVVDTLMQKSKEELIDLIKTKR